MAPHRKKSNLNSANTSKQTIKHWMKTHLEWNQLVSLFVNPKNIYVCASAVIILEILINVFVIENVAYTEIDWKAYMQEVEGFLNGTWDYSKLRGDTGPLVYPAGFVYIYSALYYITSQGVNIKIAQYIFGCFYIALLLLVLRIYGKTKKVPPYVFILMCCTSYRIHSIFVLRLFNDPVAMLLLYMSLNQFLDGRWSLGSIFYSLAVSVKMNILLFAPALLIAYLSNLGLVKALVQLSVCALIQLFLGIPFLLANPWEYVAGAFDLSRVFEFKWTVNWRFLPEHIFVHPYFHTLLLSLHLITLIYCVPKWITYMKSYAKLKKMEKELKPQLKSQERIDMSTNSQLFVLPLFLCNFIGVMFGRSLHYQFYIWYYHMLPHIAWCTHFKTITKLLILGVIELCWNTYPSTNLSSGALHLCHLTLLYGSIANLSKVTKVK